MQKTIRYLLLTWVLLSVSCSSARIRYEADVKTKNAPSRHYVYEHSTSVGSIPVFCGLSAIFFGGACWYYIAMPTVNQLNETKEAAQEKLDELLKGQSYKLQNEKIDLTSWQEAPDEAELSDPTKP